MGILSWSQYKHPSFTVVDASSPSEQHCFHVGHINQCPQSKATNMKTILLKEDVYSTGMQIRHVLNVISDVFLSCNSLLLIYASASFHLQKNDSSMQ